MREVVIGLRPTTLLHIAIVDYTLFTQGSLKKLYQGGVRINIQNIHQGCFLYPHQNHPCYPFPSMTPHPYPSIPPHPIFPCTYFNSYLIDAPYRVSHHPHISSLGCLLCLPLIIIPPSMLLNLLLLDSRSCSSMEIIENRRVWRDQCSNLGETLVEIGYKRQFVNLIQVMKPWYSLREVMLLHQMIKTLLIFLKTICPLIC